jgi:hypothetical protein
MEEIEMSDIPKARKMLADLKKQAADDGLIDYAETIGEIIPLLWRKQYKRKKSAVHSAKSTPELRAEIREYVKRNPNVPSQHVAIHFGVNLGRVSEALADT